MMASAGGLSSADIEREAKALELSSLTQAEAIEIGTAYQGVSNRASRGYPVCAFPRAESRVQAEVGYTVTVPS